MDEEEESNGRGEKWARREDELEDKMNERTRYINEERTCTCIGEKINEEREE